MRRGESLDNRAALVFTRRSDATSEGLNSTLVLMPERRGHHGPSSARSLLGRLWKSLRGGSCGW